MKLTKGVWVYALFCAITFAFASGAFAQSQSTSAKQGPPTLSMGGSATNENAAPQSQPAASQESGANYGGTAGFAHRVANAIERRGTWLVAETKHYYHELSGDTKDATLEDNASQALIADPRTKQAEISVEADDGVVTLMGRADSRATASHAEEDVAKLNGVKEVKNEIICPQANSTATP